MKKNNTSKNMNSFDQDRYKIFSTSLIIITIVAAALALYFARPIMVPFVLALFIRLLIDTIIDFQIKYLRVHQWLAILVSVFLIVGFFIIIIPFIINSVTTFLRSADDYNLKVLLLLDNLINKLDEFEIKIDRQIIKDSFSNLSFLDWASKALSNGANLASQSFLVLIISIFLLLGRKRTENSETWNNINIHVKKYIVTKFITSSVTGILVGIIYWFLGLELALIFASLTFLLNFIPTFGSITAVLLPLPIAFLQYDDPSIIVLLIVLPFLVHMTIDNIIEPKIFGAAFGLHPVTLILALIFWGNLWGITGMFLAAPLTAIIRISFDQSDVTKPFAALLAGNIHVKSKLKE